ncbi:MAG: hypothetical protein ABSH44_03060 [Bryobacteraceae bacterium]|jgi:hypothetical protein
MGDATESRFARALSAFLAGLQAGMLGACWMLAWMGVSAVFERRSFWTSENLMSSVFYGGAAIRRGFAASTFSGLALYLLIYSLLGAGFAMAVRDRLPRRRVTLVSLVFALCWYYAAFHLIARSVAPLIALLHAEGPTVIGHAIYGAFLARYPVYLPGAGAVPVASAPEVENPGAEPPVPEAHSEGPEQ